MEGLDKRGQGIKLLREYARECVNTNPVPHGVRKGHAALTSALGSLLEEFRTEFDMPGVRYWHCAEDSSYFTTLPGEQLPRPYEHLAIELARHEFLSRQGIWRSYEEDSL